MNKLFDDPNVLIIDDNNIDPEQLVNDYAEALVIAETEKGVKELLWGFLFEAEYMILRQYLIDEAKQKLGILEALDDDRKAVFESFEEDE